MTINTDESDERVDDSTEVVNSRKVTAPVTSEPATSPTFFQRFCACCGSSTIKEPPVQLIRSGSLTYTNGQPVSETVISTAKESVDDDENLNLKMKKIQKNEEKVEDVGSLNMNDILMDDVFKSSNTEDDRTEVVEEDAVSISPDVVQEIDEKELKKALKRANETNNQQTLKGRSGIAKSIDSLSIDNENIDGESEELKMSVIEFIRSETEIEKEEDEDDARKDQISTTTKSEISDSDDEASDNGEKMSVPIDTSSKTTARIDPKQQENQIEDFQELRFDEQINSSSDDDDDDKIISHSSPPPPLPAISPPPLQTISPNQLIRSPIPPPRSPRPTSIPITSAMYEHADSSDSEDDVSTSSTSSTSSDTRSAPNNPPISGSNGLIKMQPIVFAPHGKVDKDNDFLSTDEDENEDIQMESSSNEEEQEEKENDNAITRISVKSDGRAEIHSPHSPVRVTLETDRQVITDDEFSEKLI